MNRQDQFERVYAELTGREVEAIRAMRFRITEGYASPKIADAYRVFCASTGLVGADALKALEVLVGACEMNSAPYLRSCLRDAIAVIERAKGVAQ